MTKITFYKKNDMLTGFEVSGHTGKDDWGKDILCAQISTIAQLAVAGVQNVGKLDAFVSISDGYLKLKLSERDAQREKVQFLLQTCLESFKAVIVDEKKYAKLEVKNDN